MKLWRCLAAGCLCAWLSAPASADTIATFTLDGVTFNDSTTATGAFVLDLTTSTLSNVNVTTSNTNYTIGALTGGVTAFTFDNGFSFLGGYSLALDLLTTLTTANVVNGASFALDTANSGEVVFFLPICGFDPCSERSVTGGSLDVSNVIDTSATPLPAALPLFASGIAGLGWLARRRRKQAAA